MTKKVVRSFSLDKVVAAAIERIERNKRSQRVNQILKAALVDDTIQKSNYSDRDVREIKQMLRQIIDNSGQIAKLSGVENEDKQDQVVESLGKIINMRG